MNIDNCDHTLTGNTKKPAEVIASEFIIDAKTVTGIFTALLAGHPAAEDLKGVRNFAKENSL